MQISLLLTKRHKFIITSAVLSLGFIGINLAEISNRFLGVGLLTIATTILFMWSLKESIGKNATSLVLLLPSLFTLGVGLFWFLLPVNPVARIPVVLLYGIGIYALSLTSNIFTVSAIRTIALSRAAKGVGFVLTLFTAFLLYDTIFSIRAPIFINAIAVPLVSYPLFLQGLWTSKLDRTLSRQLLVYSGVFSYSLALITILLYFWPVTVVVGSLFVTVAIYVTLGLGQAKLEGRLFKGTMREYLLVGLLVFIVMVFATSWRG